MFIYLQRLIKLATMSMSTWAIQHVQIAAYTEKGLWTEFAGNEPDLLLLEAKFSMLHFLADIILKKYLRV